MNMSSSVQLFQGRLPFQRDHYDSTPQLSAAEQMALHACMDYLSSMPWWPPSSHESLQTLKRLLTPIDAILALAQCPKERYPQVKRFLCQEMYQRRTSFWDWSAEQWSEIIGTRSRDFCQRYTTAQLEVRLYLTVIGYLLGSVTHPDVFEGISSYMLAKKVFGIICVEEAIQRVATALNELGYTQYGQTRSAATAVGYVLLLNRSPLLTEITFEMLKIAQQRKRESYLRYNLVALSQALVHLGIISHPLDHVKSEVPFHSGVDSACRVTPSASLPSVTHADERHNFFPDLTQFDRCSALTKEEHTTLTVMEERFPVSDMQEQSSSHASQDTASNNPPSMSPRWQWPLDITVYDRTPQLTEMERTELTLMMDRFARGILPWRKASLDILQRLLHPMYDVFQVIGTKTRAYSGITHVLLEEMHRRQTSFWAWSEYEWLETIGQHEGDFSHRHGGKKDDAYRQSVAVVGYLLGQFNTLTLVDRISPYPLACKIFGTTQVDHAVQQIHHTLASWGHTDARYKAIKNALCVVFLSNRSPLLSDISLSILETLQVSQMPQYLKHDLVLISLALVTLGLLSSPLERLTIARAGVGENGDESPSQEQIEGAASVERKNIPDPQWLAWCKRWRDTSPLAAKTRASTYYSLLQAGRWLKQEHPEVNTPEGWNRELAAEYVGAVGHMTIGQWSQPATIPMRLIGKPIMARQQAHLLSAMRTFFRDCQEWQWIPMRFDPRRSFATPRSVRGRIGPNPRVLADDVWAKLLILVGRNWTGP